ncbi:unnamed protein product [Bursaphelenchus okinawaensis]|uniref:Mitochondrial cytochrome c oxidase subunit VIc/VIIs domain-containing protein n=1 Tax=Bursaphelenchus okinawaensis TaxID=465554 RepID=A0A811JR13_9BILA|nr:unnamed protein product [Bursaphelenchus okinawaensis]CAG9079497.1 unnamed protein product [Bursaphelenchus okinawaensis]
MSSPPAPMRQMLHSSARRFIWASLAVSIGATVLFNLTYVNNRRRNYEAFYASYDPYKRMQEICSYERKYLHTCPTELAKRAEEKGIEISPL